MMERILQILRAVMPDVPSRQTIISLVVGVIAFQLAVDLRQWSGLHAKKPPSPLRPWLPLLVKQQKLIEDAEKKKQTDRGDNAKADKASEKVAKDPQQIFEESQAYARHKIAFKISMTCLDLLQNLFMLLPMPTWILALPMTPDYQFNYERPTGLKLLWDTAVHGVHAVLQAIGATNYQPGESTYTAGFTVLITLVMLPYGMIQSYYKTFYLEAQHGFNKTTLSTWCTDLVKNTFIELALGIPITIGALRIVRWKGEDFVITLGLCWCVIRHRFHF